MKLYFFICLMRSKSNTFYMYNFYAKRKHMLNEFVLKIITHLNKKINWHNCGFLISFFLSSFPDSSLIWLYLLVHIFTQLISLLHFKTTIESKTILSVSINTLITKQIRLWEFSSFHLNVLKISTAALSICFIRMKIT